MKSAQAIRRFISASWLAAAPVVILFLLTGIPLVVAVVSAIIERVFGHETAEAFSSLWFGALMWGAQLAVVLTSIGLANYGIVRISQWPFGNKKP